MWQFKSNHIGGFFNRSLTTTFEMLLNGVLFPQTFQIAQVSAAQELHFLSRLAQLLIGGLILTKLRRYILEDE